MYEKKIKLAQHSILENFKKRKTRSSENISSLKKLNKDVDMRITSPVSDDLPQSNGDVNMDDEMMEFYSSIASDLNEGDGGSTLEDKLVKDEIDENGTENSPPVSQEELLEYEECKRRILADLNCMNPITGECVIRWDKNFLPKSFKVLHQDYFVSRYTLNMCHRRNIHFHDIGRPSDGTPSFSEEKFFEEEMYDSDIETSSSSDSESVSSLSDSEDVSFPGWYKHWDNLAYMKKVMTDADSDGCKRKLDSEDENYNPLKICRQDFDERVNYYQPSVHGLPNIYQMPPPVMMNNFAQNASQNQIVNDSCSSHFEKKSGCAPQIVTGDQFVTDDQFVTGDQIVTGDQFVKEESCGSSSSSSSSVSSDAESANESVPDEAVQNKLPDADSNNEIVEGKLNSGWNNMAGQFLEKLKKELETDDVLLGKKQNNDKISHQIRNSIEHPSTGCSITLPGNKSISNCSVQNKKTNRSVNSDQTGHLVVSISNNERNSPGKRNYRGRGGYRNARFGSNRQRNGLHNKNYNVEENYPISNCNSTAQNFPINISMDLQNRLEPNISVNPNGFSGGWQQPRFRTSGRPYFANERWHSRGKYNCNRQGRNGFGRGQNFYNKGYNVSNSNGNFKSGPGNSDDFIWTKDNMWTDGNLNGGKRNPDGNPKQRARKMAREFFLKFKAEQSVLNPVSILITMSLS